MLGELPPVERLDAAAVPDAWRATLERVAAGEARALLRRDGKPIAALLALDDYLLFVRLDERRRKDFAALDELQRAYAEAFADVPEDELEAEIAKAIKEVRAGIGSAPRAAHG